ncbi:MAG: DUF4411 family protein [Massilia sp.]
MLVFDASSTLYAWDNYPIHQFPRLWDWLGQLVSRREIAFAAVAYLEIHYKAPDCSAWLEQEKAYTIDVTNAIAQAALAIQRVLGIAHDDYGSGVDENDIFVIATAKTHKCSLVSDEAVQALPPKNKKKYKIPLVCSMPEVGVSCMNFVSFLKQSGAVF